MSLGCMYRKPGRPIPTKESHLLWAKSAGRCAYPNCSNRCIESFENAGPILLGEMAHVIAYSKRGPRPATENKYGTNRYENLVLLCAHHHTMVDKAPEDFPPDLLRRWKKRLEDRVANALDLPVFRTKGALYDYARSLLNENKSIHDNFGPSSHLARKNPLSNLQGVWEARKTEQIIPNNSQIVAAFRRYRDLVPPAEYAVFSLFETHALVFAASAQQRLDSVPMFPAKFAEIIERNKE